MGLEPTCIHYGLLQNLGNSSVTEPQSNEEKSKTEILIAHHELPAFPQEYWNRTNTISFQAK
jgi:hypothetical protein